MYNIFGDESEPGTLARLAMRRAEARLAELAQIEVREEDPLPAQGGRLIIGFGRGALLGRDESALAPSRREVRCWKRRRPVQYKY